MSFGDDLRRLVSDGPAEWRGLPAQLAPGDLEGVLDIAADHGLGAVGYERAFFRSARLLGPDTLVTVWLSTDEQEVLALELALELTPAALLAALGEPEAHFDAARGTLSLEGAEWVWPERGIAAVVDERLVLFPAAPLDSYEEMYRPQHPPARRLP